MFCAAGLALLILSPILLLVALAVRLESKGPILFSPSPLRLGQPPFRACKFRTMWTHLGDARGVNQTQDKRPACDAAGRDPAAHQYR